MALYQQTISQKKDGLLYFKDVRLKFSINGDSNYN